MVGVLKCLLVALCVTLTSSRAVGPHDNRNKFYGSSVSDVKVENVQTPPFSNGWNIDYNNFEQNFPGNQNVESREEKNCEKLCKEGKDTESCFCQLPSFLNEVFAALSDSNDKSNEYQIVPFDRDDIAMLRGSELCKTMCDHGVKRPPCICE